MFVSTADSAATARAKIAATSAMSSATVRPESRNLDRVGVLDGAGGCNDAAEPSSFSPTDAASSVTADAASVPLLCVANPAPYVALAHFFAATATGERSRGGNDDDDDDDERRSGSAQCRAFFRNEQHTHKTDFAADGDGDDGDEEEDKTVVE